MKIGRRFNTLSRREYIEIIDHHGKYTDFNVLGLYRSLCENEKLSLEARIELRDYANLTFGKTYEFLQIKDPDTYFKLSTLGMTLTVADERQIWRDIEAYQERTLQAKRIKHRNFGDYSKHNCGVEGCPFNGMMIRQGSPLVEVAMRYHSSLSKREKAEQRRKDRREKRRIIREGLDEE